MWQKRQLTAFLVFLCAVLPACRRRTAARPAFESCPVARVVDGDTIRVTYQGREGPVRLLNIDTPERGQPGYRETTEAMRRLVLHSTGRGRAVVLEFETPGVEKRGRYGRLLAYVFVDGLSVNVEMVRQGHSRFWTKYGRGRCAREFEAAEEEARKARRGVWADRR